MSPFPTNDPLIRLEEAVKSQVAEQKRKEREERASRARRYRELEEEWGLWTPTFLDAVKRAEEPYQTLLLSPEWSRTLAAINLGKVSPVTALDVPVPILYPRQYLSFGPSVRLQFKIHLMAPCTRVVEVRGTLAPIIEWWTTGRSVPLEEGSPLVSLSDRVNAYPTLLNLCDLLQTGLLLPAIQAAYLRSIAGSPLRRFARAVTSRLRREGSAGGTA